MPSHPPQPKEYHVSTGGGDHQVTSYLYRSFNVIFPVLAEITSVTQTIHQAQANIKQRGLTRRVR